MSACAPQQKEQPAPALDPSGTIGSLSRVYAADAIQVRGIGIVAGLNGTGSSECPAAIRQELEKYIWRQVPDKGSINARAFIESLNTAVVEVIGTIRFMADTNTFDVVVRPLAGTQTTSLDAGYLYTVELKEMSRLASIDQFKQYSQTIATASGPIYSNKRVAGREKNWYVMGGGQCVQKPSVKLILNKPNFIAASVIRNRINERFGPRTCVAVSDSECTLYFPVRYQTEKTRFIEIVNSLLLSEKDELRQDRIVAAIDQLVREPNKVQAATILEGVGKTALDELSPLLKHPDAGVRFQAARCMLNLGSNEPVECLRSIVTNTGSPYRLEAIRCLGANARIRDTRPLLMSLLSEENLDIRLTAYEMLERMESPVVMRKKVGGGNFTVDSVLCDGPKMIYVYQKDQPRIVLFGCPIQCTRDLFIQSDDKSITLNAKPGDPYISVSRKHPSRPRVIGPINSSFDVALLIETLGEMPERDKNTALRPGLAVHYAEIVPLLAKMCSANAIGAKFIAGPEFEVPIQNSAPSSR
ncbi:MAG: flagellar basal body P-ring protein FlgI [Planctomycetaceae bacterium]|nr:flagellar basal body P-ring protein FlgI [Planctomycetaceae bacterium]